MKDEGWIMKKFISILSVLLVACMLFASCGAPVESETESNTESQTETETETETEAPVVEEKYMQRTYTMADAKDYYRPLGRVKESGTSLICDWNASGAEFAMDCVGDVKLTFNFSGDSNKYMSVFIDDTFSEDFELLPGNLTYTIAQDLPEGFHVIRVVVQNPQIKGAISKITLTGKLVKNAASDVFVEYIGDSITCGAFLSPTGGDYATKGHAYIALNKLGVDYAICARGGQPFSLPSNVTSLYSNYNGKRDSSDYVPTRKADLLIVNLGTNDNWQWYSQTGKTNNPNHETFNYENFDKGAAEFFEMIDKIHGEKAVPILFVFGCTTNPKYTMGTDRMQKLIKEVYIPAGYDIQIAFLTTNRDGKDGHPNEAGAKQQGEDLANYLKEHYPEIFG